MVFFYRYFISIFSAEKRTAWYNTNIKTADSDILEEQTAPIDEDSINYTGEDLTKNEVNFFT